MRILIVEDEIGSARNLSELLRKVYPACQIMDILPGVGETIDWLSKNDHPDLAFFDVRLSDGTAFDILERQEIKFPIIFCTAYNQYVMTALEYNAIDYLLKPYSEQRLRKSLDKVDRLTTFFHQQVLQNLNHSLKPKVSAYKQQLLVKSGLENLPINIDEIAYCFTEHKLVFVKHRNQKNYLCDLTLLQLQEQLDPEVFFRANRQFLVHRQSVEKFRIGYKSKILLELVPAPGMVVVVSQEKARSFKDWIRGGKSQLGNSL